LAFVGIWTAAADAQIAPGEPLGVKCTTRMECMRTAANLLWNKYIREIEVSQAEYDQALAEYRRVQQDRNSSPADIARAKQQLDLKAASYRHAHAVLRTVVSTEYKGDLQANRSKADKELGAAQATLAKYKAAFQRLQSTNAVQREAGRREIEGIREEEQNLHRSLALFGVQAAMETLGVGMSHPPEAVQQFLTDQLKRPDLLAAMHSFGPNLGAYAALLGVARNPELEHAALEFAHFTTVTAAEAFGTFSAPTLVAMAAGPALLEMGFDAAILRNEIRQRHTAEQRLQELGNTEKYWRERVQISEKEVEQLKFRREIAQFLIEQQEKVSRAGAGMRP